MADDLAPQLASAKFVEDVPVEATASPPPFPFAEDTATAPPPAIIAAPLELPVAAKTEEEKGSFELRFGRVWLVRVGIALLLTGLVLLGNFAYKNWIRDLPAEVRLAALYLGSALMAGGGIYIGRRETMRRFGEVLLAGGLAFFYWCTFAAHHVPRLRVVDSPVLAGVALLAAAAGIVAVSLRRDSRGTALMGILLASYATILQPLGWLSAASNLVLALAGTALMARPGWASPGVVSMAGTYASFLWWQIAGAHGARPEEPAALYFLPPVWMVFATPGVLRLSGWLSGLGERGRAWFASANSGAFFALFSALWLAQKGREDYWLVPAVFGAVLVTLGIIGRRKDAAGGSHLSQGLGALTLAMTLKLEGDALAIGLAVQAFGLGLAFARFRGKSELAFSTLAAVGVSLWLVASGEFAHGIASWSRGIAALLVIAAAFPLRNGCDPVGGETGIWKDARIATTAVFSAGCVAALAGWCVYLETGWRLIAVTAISLGMTAFTLLADRQRRLPEAAVAAMVFQVAGIVLLAIQLTPLPWWAPGVAAGLSLVAHWLCVHRSFDAESARPDLQGFSKAFAALTALAVAAAIYRTIRIFDLKASGEMLAFGLAAAGVAAAGRFWLRSPVLMIAAAFLLPSAVRCQLQASPIPWVTEFIPLAASLAVTALALLPIRQPASAAAAVVARCCALVSWLLTWAELAPDAWGDVMATSALLIALASARMKSRTWPEAWLLLGAAGAWLVMHFVTRSWHLLDSPPALHGWMVVAVCFAAAFVVKTDRVEPRSLRHSLLTVACVLMAAWVTQSMVWHFDWKPVAILWTGLGFLLVCTGLWQKLAALRHAGFALLTAAVLKLFVMDVWDFATFTRIIAFLALGVALVVLGFFYNRFADVLKKLFEGDEA